MDPHDNGHARCHNTSAIFNVTSALNNAFHPPILKISNIWCMAKNKKNDIRKISGGVYWKTDDKKSIGGIIEKHGRTLRLSLEIQNGNFSHLGEYRCDLYVDSKIRHYYASEFLRINMRPVFILNTTTGFKTEEKDRFAVIAPKIWETAGETVFMHCPSVAFPRPDTVWYKQNDGSEERVELCSSTSLKVLHNRISLHKNGTLVIFNVTDEDNGKYLCIVNNSIVTSNGARGYDATLSYELEIKGHYLWVLPLIIIVVMTILLFIIIYGCGIIKRCRSYNVEKREKGRAKASDIRGANGEGKSAEPMLSDNKNEFGH
uniref:Ig-like domain-containing protein n=1 Tax=Syphacia muris TaxID=451379 RepID=A0A0N5AJC2_9BILA